MRTLIAIGVVVFGLTGLQVQASDTSQPEKVKTGILPSGGFYSIYEVQCRDQSSTSIASIQRGRRWCTHYSDELTCVSRAEEAVEIACSSDSVVSAQEFSGLLD